MALTVLLPENPYSRELLALLTPLLPPDSQIRDPDAGLEGLAGQRLLFALALDESGCSESGYRMLMTLRRSRTLLEGCVAGLVVTGRGELYTKDAARDLVDRQFELATQTPVDSQAVQAVDREFHRALAHLSGNRLLERETVWIYDLCLRYIFYSMHMNWSARIAQEHRDILGAIERRDSQLAQAHVRNHLSKVKDAVLMGLAKGFDPSVELRNAREGYTIRPHSE